MIAEKTPEMIAEKTAEMIAEKPAEMTAEKTAEATDVKAENAGAGHGPREPVAVIAARTAAVTAAEPATDPRRPRVPAQPHGRPAAETSDRRNRGRYPPGSRWNCLRASA